MAMRLAVLADIHGNMPALEAVLADMQPFHPDGMIVAGDMVAGPKSAEVVRRLQELGAWMVRGNNEDYLLRFEDGSAPAWWHTAHQWAFIRWVYQHMDAESLAVVKNLPDQRVITRPGKDAIRVVHGSPSDPNEHLYPGYEGYALERVLEEIMEPVLVCGHTHIPWSEYKNGCLAFNPGAVCAPLNGVTGAQYALLEWKGDGWELDFRQAKYDISLVRKAFTDSGLLNAGGAIARAFLMDIEQGKNISMDLVKYAYRQAAADGFPDCEYVPNEIWDRAEKTFDWNKTG